MTPPNPHILWSRDWWRGNTWLHADVRSHDVSFYIVCIPFYHNGKYGWSSLLLSIGLWYSVSVQFMRYWPDKE